MVSEASTNWADFEPRAYLDEYYADVGPENVALLRFFSRAFRGLSADSVLMDLGSGPTIYSLISAAALVREIHVCDYLDANLEEVRAWLRGDRSAWDWTEFVATALRLESGADALPPRVGKREGAIRKCVTRVIRCDISRLMPLGEPVRTYDVVVTNFCAESITDDKEAWQGYLRNIGSVLRPGGRLVITALKGATSYSVGTRLFPAVSVTDEDLWRALIDTDFVSESVSVESVPADRPHRKYQGILLALATKRAGA
jgi:SAM-dependent methyltransferase